MALRFEYDVPLGPLTTLGVGGKAATLVRVTTEAELQQAGRFAKQNALPVLLLGGGSNVLASDEGFAGLVIRNEIGGRRYEEDGGGVVKLYVGAGEVLDEVIAETVEKGYWGLENLSHIPGTVGATPVQNVGAYGVEIAERLIEVRAYHFATDSMVTLSNEQCVFGYRDSFFKTAAGRAYCITEVVFSLSSVPTPKLSYADLAQRFASSTPALSDIREAVIEIRAGKFPDWTKVGTAGSFFKNPVISRAEAATLRAQYPELPMYPASDDTVKVSLGYLLDKVCKLRGFRDGAVGLYEKQALVLVVYEHTTSQSVKNFAQYVTQKVKATTGISIETEVMFV